MKITICDVCGKKVDKLGNDYRTIDINYKLMYDTPYKESFDVCNKCYDTFIDLANTIQRSKGSSR